MDAKQRDLAIQKAKEVADQTEREHAVVKVTPKRTTSLTFESKYGTVDDTVEHETEQLDSHWACSCGILFPDWDLADAHRVDERS